MVGVLVQYKQFKYYNRIKNMKHKSTVVIYENVKSKIHKCFLNLVISTVYKAYRDRLW